MTTIHTDEPGDLKLIRLAVRVAADNASLIAGRDKAAEYRTRLDELLDRLPEPIDGITLGSDVETEYAVVQQPTASRIGIRRAGSAREATHDAEGGGL